MKRVIGYIDGFNLYHSIDDLNKPHLKWLDLQALVKSIARSGESVEHVYYFSAYATWRSLGAQTRHREYVKALTHQGVECVLGHFKKKTRKCNSCGDTWDAHEEKETDVHLGARLVADAYEDRFDRALIITADSDLVPAVNIVSSAFPAKEIFAVSPPGRHAHARGLSPKLTITNGRLTACRLPEFVADNSGADIFRCPAAYALPL